MSDITFVETGGPPSSSRRHFRLRKLGEYSAVQAPCGRVSLGAAALPGARFHPAAFSGIGDKLEHRAAALQRRDFGPPRSRCVCSAA